MPEFAFMALQQASFWTWTAHIRGLLGIYITNVILLTLYVINPHHVNKTTFTLYMPLNITWCKHTLVYIIGDNKKHKFQKKPCSKDYFSLRLLTNKQTNIFLSSNSTNNVNKLSLQMEKTNTSHFMKPCNIQNSFTSTKRYFLNKLTFRWKE